MRIPALVSCLILAAHFLRGDNLIGLLLAVALPILFFSLKRRWTLRALQAFLAFGAVMWPVVAFAIAGDRMIEQKPMVRMLLILFSVGAFTGWSAWLLNRPAILARYPARLR